MNKGHTLIEALIALFMFMMIVIIAGSAIYRTSVCLDKGKSLAYCVFDNEDEFNNR